MSQPVEGGASPESIKVGEMEDQMRNQERILAQLHESIIAQDKQILGREAEAQSYASKLENLKNKHARDHVGQEEAIPGTSVRMSVPTKGGTPKSSGSLTLLRQKVEENRVKVAQRGRQELESKRELEEKVQALKNQLEEMQRVPAAPTAPDQNPVDTQMIALQEQIQAKDSLIEARTRAITLLSEDFSRKRKEVVDQLEETREEMRHMQNKFITCEDYYKVEIQTRDNRLFELDSKVRALSVKLEQTEELKSVVAENEHLHRQIGKLYSIRDEKKCLEDKLKELLSLLDVHQQKEVQMSLLLEEKQRLLQHNLEELSNLSDVNQKKEEEFYLLLKDKQRLEHQVEELGNLSDVIRQKEEELSINKRKNQSLQKKVDKLARLLADNEKKAKEISSIENNNQQHEEELSNLSKEKESLENKVEELSQLLDSNQQKERAASLEKNIILVGANSQQADEMTTLLKEKQSLRQKLESLTGFLDDIHQERDLPSQLQSDKLDELIDLARQLYVNDQKVGDLHCVLDTNQEKEIGSILDHEKLVLKRRLEHCSALLKVHRETIKDLCLDKEQSDNFDAPPLEELLKDVSMEELRKAEIEGLSKLVDTHKRNYIDQELLAREFEASQLRLQEQSQRLTNFQLKEEELLNALCNYERKCKELTIALENKEPLQNKVDELSKLIDANRQHHKEDLSIIVQEKQLLHDRVQELSNIIEANNQNILALNEQLNGIQQQHNQELATIFQDKQSLQDTVQELSNHIQANCQVMQGMQDSLDANKQQQQIKVNELLDTIALNNKCLHEMEAALATSQQQHNVRESVLLEKTQLLDAKVDDYLELLKEKEVLQTRVHEMAAIIETNKGILETMNDNVSASEDQHYEALSELNKEKQHLQDKVKELSNIIENNEQNIRQMSDRLNSLQQHNDELSKAVAEKQVLQDKLQELSITIDTSENNLQIMTHNLSMSEKRHHDTLSQLNREKRRLEDKVRELSYIVANNKQTLQVLNEHINTLQERNEESSKAVAEKQVLQEKLQELSTIIDTNEKKLQIMNHNLSTSEEQHYEALAASHKEKQHLQDKVHELSNIITNNEQTLQVMNEHINTLQQHNEESSKAIAEKQVLQEKLQELSTIIDTNEKNLQIMNHNLSTSEEQHYEALAASHKEKQHLQDKVQELSNIIDNHEWHVKEINDLLTENMQRVQELSSLLQIANQEKANQKKEIEQLIEARQGQMSEQLSYIQEKQHLHDQVAELSALLNASQKEKVEEIGNLLAEKSSHETEVKHLSNLIEEGKEKQKLALSKAHKKITDLKRHVNSLEKADDSSALMVDLQNRIAELEEEKGNLQLHLVDFEEFKALGVELTAQVELLQAQKVTAEMKSVELEEELDNLRNQSDSGADAAIDALQSQLIRQVENFNVLNEQLIMSDSDLAHKLIECEGLINSQQQLEENCSALREGLALSEIKVHNLSETLHHKETSFDELIKASQHIVNTMDKFCSEIVNGRICDMESESALGMEETMQVANIEGIHHVQLQEFNAKLGELLPAISKARASLLNREVLLGALKTELSEACNRTSNLETRLQQLEYCENETVCLKNEVDSLKGLLLEQEQQKSNQFPPQVGSFFETDWKGWPEQPTTVAFTPGNRVSTTQAYQSQIANIALNDETKTIIDLLGKEVARLHLELRSKRGKMEEASTQADDDQLTWLSNEYESVKLEIQDLIEEIHSKDATLIEVTGELQSKREQWDELLEEVARLRERISARDGEVACLEELLRQHRGDTVDSSSADMLLLLQQKEDQVARLEAMLRQQVDEEHDVDPPDRQLDESLYMLHQKEVRCDELTLELMQLLEERDTLQLRLSTTIRQYEELRASCAHEDNKCTSTPSPTPNNSPMLSNKLQEVRSMGREQRSMALQQRADATVSRDNQSQSETLINWIRGRTTPKVMHI